MRLHHGKKWQESSALKFNISFVGTSSKVDTAKQKSQYKSVNLPRDCSLFYKHHYFNHNNITIYYKWHMLILIQ